MQKQWKLSQLNESPGLLQITKQLATNSPFPKSLANILWQRGYRNIDAIKGYFRPQNTPLHDPFLMKGMKDAVERIMQALEEDQPIMILGDYDVDGTTATSLLLLFMQEIQAKAIHHIPDRYKEGYGMSMHAIDRAVQNGVKLIITVDCGTKNLEEIDYAVSKEIDVIVCDHHTPGETLPDAWAILNPKQEDCKYPFKELTGCGIAYKLAVAIEKHLFGIEKDWKSNNYLDLVVLSIASDIVPIVGENRTLAWMGLEKMKRDPLPGVKMIMNQSERSRKWTIGDLMFFIGPRINAAGRLHHADMAVETLTGSGDHKNHLLAEQLHHANESRKEVELQIFESAIQKINTNFSLEYSNVLYDESWHKGVIGIVASKIVEENYRPTILMTKSNGKWVGSCRSVKGFDIHEALEACSDVIYQFGGHKYAAGLTVEEENLEEFILKFEQYVSKNIQPQQRTPSLKIDHILQLADIDEKLIRILNRMEPFGPENPRPVFLAQNVVVTDYQVMKDVHIKLTLDAGDGTIQAVGFNMAEHVFTTMGDWQNLDIAYYPDFNEFRGNRSIQIMIKDVKLAGEFRPILQSKLYQDQPTSAK